MDQQGLEKAIAVLNQHREAVGPEVVSLAVTALREKIAALASLPLTQQHEQATVLVADLSGFTAMSELMDAEEVRDTVNAVWQKLDSVVESWGGQIDKHVGDGVIALFGVQSGHEDNVERAVQAALDMQLELALFNERALKLATQIMTNWSRPPDLKMRIGITSGSVFMGKVGTSDAYTAVGETVTTAMELEERAPVGGILISKEVYGQVRDHFDVEMMPPMLLSGWREAQPVYTVRREKPQYYHVSGLGVEGISARMVGRTNELSQLQTLLSNVIATGSLHLVTIAGEMGVGKSRLMYAFEQWLNEGPQKVAVLSGRVHYDTGQLPFHLIRDAFANYLEIYPRSSAAVAREKLVHGILELFQSDDVRSREQAHFIGHLLGFDFSASPFLQGIGHNMQRVREFAFQDVAALLAAMTRNVPAVVLLLEDAHWADEGALDLLEYLVQECQELPLLLVVTARPDLGQKRPSWQWLDALYPHYCTRIRLSALSAIDSRLMVTDLLSSAAPVPLRLIDQIVNDTAGNPLFIEEYIKLLIDDGVVVKGANRWRIELSQMRELPRPLTVADMLVTQLERLDGDARTVLHVASVLGRVFWETAVVELLQSVNRQITLTAIEQALIRLERAALIYRRRISLFAGVPEYVFRHDALRKLAYSQTEPVQRQQYHTQAATWFTTNAQREGRDFTATIAFHHALADDAEQAASWYGRAGEEASKKYAPDTAIRYYNQAMSWISHLELQPSASAVNQERMAMYEGLGEMLRWQAHYDEAVEAYEQMRQLAVETEDWSGVQRAEMGLFTCHDFQGEYSSALEAAREAVAAARQVGHDEDEAIGLAAVGWAYAWMGDIDEAVVVAENALRISSEALASRGVAYSNMLLAHVYRVSGHFMEATQYLEKAITILREIGDRLWEGLAQVQLGHVARDHQDYGLARQRYLAGLRVGRDLGDRYAIMICLQSLGRVCQLQEDHEAADRYLRQAVLLAEKSGNLIYLANTAVMLGELHLAQYMSADSLVGELERQSHWEQADAWFARVIAQESLLTGKKAPLVARLGMGRLQMVNGRPLDALVHVRSVLEQIDTDLVGQQSAWIRIQIIAWRTLGSITADLPERELPLMVQGVAYQPEDCFLRSLRLCESMPGRFDIERAYTLRAWATHEIYEGNREKGKAMWYEALSIFTAVGKVREVDWMSSFAY